MSKIHARFVPWPNAEALQGLNISEAETVFSSTEFHNVLVSTFPPENLQALELSKSGNPFALLPMALHTQSIGPLTLRETGFPRNAHALRNSVPDAQDPDVWRAILTAWLDHLSTDTLSLQNLPDAQDQDSAIRNAAHDLGLEIDPPAPGRQLDYADLDDGFDSFLASRSGQFRRQLRKRTAQLEAAGTLRIECYRGHHITDAFPDWKSVVNQSWQASEGLAPPEDWHLHKLMAGSGLLWLLRVDSRPIAALRMLEDNTAAYVHTMHFANSARDMAPGLVLFAEMMRDAATRGLARVDFNGTSPFFRRWSTGTLQRVSMRIYRQGIQGFLVRTARQTMLKFRSLREPAGISVRRIDQLR